MSISTKFQLLMLPCFSHFLLCKRASFLFATTSKHRLIFKQITKGAKIYSKKFQFTNGHK